jgi:hypothetical protein|nr:MAG TPA: terminase small subunit [Caudoviricetes sp.]
MRQTEYQKDIKKIVKKAKTSMEAIGTYKPQFDDTIAMYAETKYQYNKLMQEFYSSGCKVTEEYTNKGGATNIRKTATYLALETLRKDIINHESVLGLTPAGLKKINATESKPKKGKGLADALKKLE